MSPQADYVVSNGTGAAVRSDINGQLAAIVSNNSGASAPATTYAYMLWADTSTNLLKLRNGANSAWITVGDLTAANLGLATLASPTFTGTATIPTLTVSTAANIPLGSAASPTLYFTGDSNTGLYSPGADQVALSTGGTGRLFIDSSGRCGIGTSSPSYNLQVAETSAVVSAASFSTFFGQGTRADLILRATSSAADQQRQVVRSNSDSLIFGTENSGATAFTEKVRIDSSGRVGIGTQSPVSNLTVQADSLPFVTVIDTNTTTLQLAAGTGGGAGGAIIACDNGPIVFRRNTTYNAHPSTSGSETARFDTDGRLLVGTSTARANFFNASLLSSAVQIEGTTHNTSGLSIVRNEAGSTPYICFGASRGTTIGSNIIVQANDPCGYLTFQGNDGSEFVEAAIIKAEIDGTPGANDMPGRLVFSTTADGAASPTERMRITQSGAFFAYSVYSLTGGAAANVVVDSAGQLFRSTSSAKYKTDIETLQDSYADALLECRPVWYRSTCDLDNPGWSYWGLIAEEVAAIDPRLVHWKTVEVSYDEKGSAVETPLETPEPEGVQYDRFVPHLLNLIKRQKEQIEAMEARLTALEAQ